MHNLIIAASVLVALTSAQQIGTNTAENHPSLSVATCTKSGGCTSKSQSIVLDANWRWLHTTSGYTNCYNGQTWNTTICKDATTCTTECAMDGADYKGTYGISTSNTEVDLGFVTQGSSRPNIGSRVYLMQDTTNYQMFNLLNGEFTFDVDVSQLPCGLNGALYFSQMDPDGGMKRFPTNKAGAAYGTGYCDAQCPRDLKFINGVANVEGWIPSPNDINSGKGNLGSCCSEMDIWEANSFATAYTAHPCNLNSATTCTDDACTSSCDAAGCDFNSWRLGNQTFYGADLTIDTRSKITVVTQFITDDNTKQGNLVQIQRFYVQNGEVVPNSYSSVTDVDTVNSISDNFCTQQKKAFGNDNIFANMGGLKKMGAAFKAGMVLVMSIWDDHNANCLWLDSDYPTTGHPSDPGVSRGPCSSSSGVPSDLEKNSANAKVSFSNIKWGELNSTFTADGSSGSEGGNPVSSSTASTDTMSTTTATNQLPSTSTSRVSTDQLSSTLTSSIDVKQQSSTSTSSATGAASSTAGTKTKTGGSSTCSSSSKKCGAIWTQCGGKGWSGTKCCQSGNTCQVQNEWYSQCL